MKGGNKLCNKIEVEKGKDGWQLIQLKTSKRILGFHTASKNFHKLFERAFITILFQPSFSENSFSIAVLGFETCCKNSRNCKEKYFKPKIIAIRIPFESILRQCNGGNLLEYIMVILRLAGYGNFYQLMIKKK